MTRECVVSDTCTLSSQSSEVWLDHLDQMASIPHRGFHSAFEEADADGALGMKPWKTIYEGIRDSTSGAFTLLLVFGGMQMSTVGDCDTNAAALETESCYRSNFRILHSFRQRLALDPSFNTLERQHREPSSPLSSAHRVLIISRNGTWWRRWLNEQVPCSASVKASFPVVLVSAFDVGAHICR